MLFSVSCNLTSYNNPAVTLLQETDKLPAFTFGKNLRQLFPTKNSHVLCSANIMVEEFYIFIKVLRLEIRTSQYVATGQFTL